MAAAFRPVNSPLAPDTIKEDIMTPSPKSTLATPRPSTAPHLNMSVVPDDATASARGIFTSTRLGDRPLPAKSFPQAAQAHVPNADKPRDTNSQHSSSPRGTRDSMDIDMEDSDGDGDGQGSDEGSVNADGTRSSKKKKSSQRFYCTEYPPCNLSFTRSEHLARHIRKHTGERPFQCHCSRRFSRLDNLRQHAQTVHVNEDIPIDSLAASSSRFQRQIRTERVRQAGNRARASTGGSAGGPPRGHSKSLSTSSINSISSVGSNYNTVADVRRRPPPLVMADTRARADAAYYRPQSPNDMNTPASSTFSTAGQTSPRWLNSPSSSHSRSQSMYVSDVRTPGRRLSFPTGGIPQTPTHNQTPGRPTFSGSGPINSSNNGMFSPAHGAMVSSPTSSTFSSRRESTSSAAEDAWRRRTWHSDSRSYGGHPAQFNTAANQSPMRPNLPPPMSNSSHSHAPVRLPGIESFGPIPQNRSLSPSRRQPSPMAVDAHPGPRPPVLHGTPGEDDRRNLNMYDASIQRGLTRLDISHTTPPRDSASTWASEVHSAIQGPTENFRGPPHQVVRFEEPPLTPNTYQNATSQPPAHSFHQHTMSAPSLASSRESRRRGWYNGPAASLREETPRVSQDPRVAHVERMVHPNFTGFSGFPAREEQPSYQHQQHQQVQHLPSGQQPLPNQSQTTPPPPPQQAANSPESMRRLEALVAVATSEGTTATAY